VTDWKTSVQSAGASVKNVDGLSKAKIEQAATSVSDANSKLVSSLKALGEPPHAAASEAKGAVQQLSTDLEASAHEIDKAATNVSGAKDVVSAVSVASSTLLTMATDVSSTITKLEGLDATDDWKRAFSDSPACQSLKNS
jgi:outer membrane murein-binding lipoprotein Lpp